MDMCYEKKTNDWVEKCMEYEVQGARGYTWVEFSINMASN